MKQQATLLAAALHREEPDQVEDPTRDWAEGRRPRASTRTGQSIVGFPPLCILQTGGTLGKRRCHPKEDSGRR